VILAILALIVEYLVIPELVGASKNLYLLGRVSIPWMIAGLALEGLSLFCYALLTRELLPPGVLNVITGGDRLGPWMTAHPGFNKIAFTGSTQTGRRVLGSAAETLKHVTLELGGNDPGISSGNRLRSLPQRARSQICKISPRQYCRAGQELDC